MGTHLYSAQFRAALHVRLGMRALVNPGKCDCNTQIDILGTHCLGCKEGGQRTYRHDAVRNAIFQVCQAAGLSASLEVPHLLAGCSKRPADIFLRDYSHGKNLALDVTVSNTMQNTNLSKACVETGFHAMDAADRKRQAFHKVAPNSTFILLPLSFETLGGMTQETQRTSSRDSQGSGQPVSACLMQRRLANCSRGYR